MDVGVKNFIETNIQLLEDNQTFEFFISAYNGLDSGQQAELIRILDDSHVIDTKVVKEPVVRYIIDRAIEDLVENMNVPLTRFVYTQFPSGLLGETSGDLFEYILNNCDEWSREIDFKDNNIIGVGGLIGRAQNSYIYNLFHHK